jgi:hypothetical protein
MRINNDDYIFANKDHSPEWSDDLQCYWVNFKVLEKGNFVINLPLYSSCDMTGTIRAAKRFMPNVKVIQVYEDGKESIFYARFAGGKWFSRCRRYSIPKPTPAFLLKLIRGKDELKRQ